jgi:oxygen-independent coproporphyrinogen-3 oxidase
MKQEILNKYNVPVPRYTSYPPANYFREDFTAEDYLRAIEDSNTATPNHISFYLHMPFCRRLCHYCGCNAYAMQKPEVVDQYIRALHQEIDLVAKRLDPKRRIAQIHYGGGTPTAMPSHYIRELNAHLLEAFDCIEEPEIAIECHPGYADEAYWSALLAAGFNRFSLGIQDFDERVLKTVNRKPSLLPIDEIFHLLKANGARVNMDFIYGLPLQTAESFSQTIRQAAALSPDRLVTFSYAHIPSIYKRQQILEKAGLPTGDEKSRMYEAATQILETAGYKRIGLDHFVKSGDELYTALKNGQLHRNFQGYCTRRTTGQVYAFGVTGISQLSNAYCQNTKGIAEYIERVNAGQLPVIKGYALNEQEQITREVIETLMCNYGIDWQALAERLHQSADGIKQAVNYCEEKMEAFKNDGLIEYDADKLRMTETGRLFVRNVAASMDRLMLNTNKVFSKPV